MQSKAIALDKYWLSRIARLWIVATNEPEVGAVYQECAQSLTKAGTWWYYSWAGMVYLRGGMGLVLLTLHCVLGLQDETYYTPDLQSTNQWDLKDQVSPVTHVGKKTQRTPHTKNPKPTVPLYQTVFKRTGEDLLCHTNTTTACQSLACPCFH